MRKKSSLQNMARRKSGCFHMSKTKHVVAKVIIPLAEKEDCKKSSTYFCSRLFLLFPELLTTYPSLKTEVKVSLQTTEKGCPSTIMYPICQQHLPKKRRARRSTDHQ
ncbi:uncharacterized protein LOC126088117 [Schistocerca cancellata]|uniref:uncharacterized protein LOC126088117 n=1 Tax=Schistocerca cancellata TaxID=274614 RepID=UPI002118EE01|nr:uncharacterized protein LOC126088117 [Schistocerca cancellata]